MAQKRRPKRSGRSTKRTLTPASYVRIGLTVVVVAILAILAWMMITVKDPVPPDTVRDEMLLALSRTGIPATRAERISREGEFIGFSLNATPDQAAAIQQRLENALSDYACSFSTVSSGTTRELVITSGGHAYKLVMKGAGSSGGEQGDRKTSTRSKQRYTETETHEPKPAAKKFIGQPQIAIILDDVGLGHMRSFEQALEIPYPLTFAIIPFRRYTRECASMARGHGFEMIVHMPMEPYGYPKEDPGPGAILESDSPEQIIRKVEAAMDSVAYARGMNNHMGSKVTALPFAMRVVLSTLKRQGLYFVDSRTTPDTVAESEARELGVPCLPRNVFLDNEKEPEAIRRQLQETVRFATQHGFAIAIGHNYPETIAVLAEEMPRLDRTVNFVFARELVDEAGRPD